MKTYVNFRTDRQSLASLIPLPRPFTILVESGNACNFKCTFCPESLADYKERSGGYSKLTVESFDKILRQITELGKIKLLDFHMLGEPFANKDLLTFVNMASAADVAHNILITTNGSLVKPELYMGICHSGLDYLKVSIYGGNDAMHKKRTQSSIPLSRIKENISGLKAFRDARHSGFPKLPFITLTMVTTGDAAEDAEFLKEFKDIGDEAMVVPISNWNDPDGESLDGVDTETRLAQPFFARKKQVCPYPFYTMVIHSSLDVSVCCVDWNKKAVVGNVKHETLTEIWNGARLREFRDAHLRGERCKLEACKTCTFLHTAPDNLDELMTNNKEIRATQ